MLNKKFKGCLGIVLSLKKKEIGLSTWGARAIALEARAGVQGAERPV